MQVRRNKSDTEFQKPIQTLTDLHSHYPIAVTARVRFPGKNGFIQLLPKQLIFYFGRCFEAKVLDGTFLRRHLFSFLFRVASKIVTVQQELSVKWKNKQSAKPHRNNSSHRGSVAK
jgi:hypothetical protein